MYSISLLKISADGFKHFLVGAILLKKHCSYFKPLCYCTWFKRMSKLNTFMCYLCLSSSLATESGLLTVNMLLVEGLKGLFIF